MKYPNEVMLKEWASDLLALCRAGRSLSFYPHIDADGDALGSSLALALACRKLGAKVAVLTEEPVPEKLGLLPEAGKALVITPGEEQRRYAEAQDAALVMDCPGGKRLASREPLYAYGDWHTILDHHIPNEEEATWHAWRDISSPATCELAGYLIYYMQEESGIELFDSDIATALYVGLLTDTGRFWFQKTRRSTMELAGLLLDYDVPNYELNRRLFEVKTVGRLRAEGWVGETTELLAGGRLALSLLPLEIIERYGIIETDYEGIAGALRNVEGVDLVAFLREVAPGVVKGSVRSSEAVDSQQLAVRFGGGGHARAAGFRVTDCTLEEIANRVRAMIPEIFPGEEVL